MENQKRTEYLAKNTVLFAIGNLGTKLISFFLVPLYTNALSTNQYGIIDLIASICTVLVPVLTFNIGESVMRFSLDEDADYDKIFSVGILFMGMCITLGTISIPVSNYFESTKEFGWYIYFYSVSLGICQLGNCNLRGREKLVEYAISNILHSFSIAIQNIFFLVILKKGIPGYFYAYILANIITAIYAFGVGEAVKSLHKFKIDKCLLKDMVSYSIVLIPTSFMWWIMNSSDRLMVSAMVGIDANGIYAISYKVPTLLSTLSIIFNQAWSYSAIKEDSSEDITEYSNNMYNQMVQTVVIITGGLLMVMKPFLSIYVEKSYYAAWKYTPYLMIGFMFMTLGTFLSTSYTVNKDSWGFLISGTLGAIMNLILNRFLIPIFGVSGAAFATCISYFTVYIFRSWHIRKYIIINIFKVRHLVSFAIVILMGFTMYIDSIVGQVFLLIEFVLLLILFKEYIGAMYNMCKNILLRNKHKR